MPWICKNCGAEVLLQTMHSIDKDGRKDEYCNTDYACRGCGVACDCIINELEEIAEWQEDE